MSSKILFPIFNLAVLLPGIGLTFFPATTCALFDLRSITSSTLHLSRLIGIRNLVFGVMMALSPSGSSEQQNAVRLAALTEALDVGASVLSLVNGDMDAQQATTSGTAAALTALCGWMALSGSATRK